MPRSLRLLFLFTALAFAAAAGAAPRGVVIEDFESGSVVLESYPGQDEDPSSWSVTSSNPFGGDYALRIYGNTWKQESVAPIALDSSTVWQVAAYIDSKGEMQAFGVGDGANELLYTFAGEELPQATKWWTAYQGAFPLDAWYAYLLPVGRDWRATHGYAPTIDRVFYVNDDDAGSVGVSLFDEIRDVTDDLPVAPEAHIVYVTGKSRKVGEDLFLVGVQFYGNVVDPDSPTHAFLWDFGDGATSAEQNPSHEFLVHAHHTYTVGLLVRDPDGLVGNDTCQVQVEAGADDLPFTVNFVGDIFTGRGYETTGGIIDTYGIEALFEPTLGIFGEAADLNVCNLECPYTDRGTPHPTKSVVFRSRPENIAGIAYAGVDLVSIGNNHIVDYGEEGMLQTIHLLDSLGVGRTGAHKNEYLALLPAFRTESGVRMAFLGQCNRTGREYNYQPFLDAAAAKPGFAYMLEHNLESAIASAREAADIVIAQLHGGIEYVTTPPAKDGFLPVEPPVEASELGPDDPDVRFRVEPNPGDRALRRLAADLGADVVINHHPHVLQGFESYDGKLIAHSLGNFIFDLYYPETMPTIVLTLEIDKEGIAGYTFVPAWIDDWIPHPATGTLGREIMDRMADYSRPMGALVAVFPKSTRARIHLDRGAADSTVTASLSADSLLLESGAWITPPLPLAGSGSLSRVASIGGPGSGWEVRWGREILWHGVFEEEGATFWDLNSTDEWLDATVAYKGSRSLALRRDYGDGGAVGTDLEKHLPCDPTKEHTIAGFVKADHAVNAKMTARFYSSRTSETVVSSADAAPAFTGSADWFREWKNVTTPSNGTYFEVRFANEPPASGTGHAWFDDAAFIEWEPWVAWSGDISVPSPNNFRFLQVRSTSAGAGLAQIGYEETAYRASTTPVGGPPAASVEARLRNFPNPFNPRTTIELSVPGEGNVLVRVDVFDVSGRRVAALHRGVHAGGSTLGLAWDGTDGSGRAAPSGIYFARAEVGGKGLARKMVLLR